MIDVSDHACEGCLLRKQNRNSFLVGRFRIAKQPLELVHTNICNPSEVRFLGHNKYILISIDDFIRKT